MSIICNLNWCRSHPYSCLTFELGLVDTLGFADGLLLGSALKEGDCEGPDEGFVDNEGVDEGYGPKRKRQIKCYLRWV